MSTAHVDTANTANELLISARMGMPASGASQLLGRWSRGMILRHHSQLRGGSIELSDARGTHLLGKGGELHAGVRVHRPEFFSRILFGGTVGAGESYIHGEWDCDDLVSLMRILLRNRHQLTGMERGAARLSRRLRHVRHLMRRNSRQGSRANIAAHYDLGNDLFELFLDETMMYSSAVFPAPEADLATAQRHKLDLICQSLNIQPGDRVVEIGTGWGGFAMHAAEHFGAHVTTTTISKEQHDWAAREIARRGLQDRITLLLKDYRDLQGQYDKLVSIEMIEAVGHQYYDRFMQQCASLLKPQGQALIQAITIDDERYVEARDSVDFIKEFVFPGGCLPGIAVLTQAGSEAGLRLTGLQDYAADYATTLAHWRHRFHAATEQIDALGYPREFRRLWHYYLCYCEAGFREQSIGLAHMQFTRGNITR